MKDISVLVAQPDATVAESLAKELADAGIGVAGPVSDLRHAISRAERQVLAAVLLDVDLPGGRGTEGATAFRERFPGLPLILTAPRSAEDTARSASAGRARCYLLHEEFGRGLVAPLVRDCAGGTTDVAPRTAELRRLLHDLGNLLGAASGSAELLATRPEAAGPLAAEIREMDDTLAECVRVFRRFAAAWRSGDAEDGSTGSSDWRGSS